MEPKRCSPEVVELTEKAPEQDSASNNTEKNPSFPKRKRKTVAENLKDNVLKWEAANLAGKKRGKAPSKNSPEVIDLESPENASKIDNDDDIGIIEVVPNTNSPKEFSQTKVLYDPNSPLSKRQWRNTKLGSKIQREGLKPGAFPFSVMTYNVLAQDLQVQHPYLYEHNDPNALQWLRRHEQIMKEIRLHLPDVLCLQEVQASHLQEYFKQPLSQIGYDGIYKQRTGDKVDGCAIFWQRGKFYLLEDTSVEFYQPGVQILNRDNIAIVARLALQGSADQIVVATTHLLYNPRRSDIRLAQVQLLLAELDRLSHKGKNAHVPVILTGDFNLYPHVNAYLLVTSGQCHTENSTAVLPQYLGITDCCRHTSIVTCREKVTYTERTSEVVSSELKLLQLYHSERKQNSSLPSSSEPTGEHKFGTGKLEHKLKFQSVYEHHKGIRRLDQEVTTHQEDWCTVDYIFFSTLGGQQAKDQRKLRLLSRWSLPNVADCEIIGPIPNFDAPSDHFPLVACFLLS